MQDRLEHRVSISVLDSELDYKAPADAARHTEKLKQAIKDSLPEVVAEQNIITSNGTNKVRVPLRSLEHPYFRWDTTGRSSGSGEGDGAGSGSRPGRGRRAGDGPGSDYLEVEMTIDDLAHLLFEDLHLPNLTRKKQDEMEAETFHPNGRSRRGIMPNLDKRHTVLQNIKRNAMSGRPAKFDGVNLDDLRFRVQEREVKREMSAVVLAMRDVSGSMGEFEKYISRSFYFWMSRFLKTKYSKVEVVFMTHHTEAKIVDEETFFKMGESGGTKVSSAYQLALDVIGQRYDPTRWNIYPFHFSDGDNWGDTDNQKCLELATNLTGLSSMMGYGEIRQGGNKSTSTLMGTLSSITDPKFVTVTINQKEDVYPALRRFFADAPAPKGVAA